MRKFLNGWVRLWVVISGAMIIAISIYGIYFVFSPDACYSLITISPAKNLENSEQELIKSLQSELGKKIFCGTKEDSTLQTLENLAKRGSVEQVAFQWLEPNGWSMDKRNAIDIFGEFGSNKIEIEAKTIIGTMTRLVYEARGRIVAVWIGWAVLASIFLLLSGLSVAWVRNGFGK